MNYIWPIYRAAPLTHEYMHNRIVCTKCTKKVLLDSLSAGTITENVASFSIWQNLCQINISFLCLLNVHYNSNTDDPFFNVHSLKKTHILFVLFNPFNSLHIYTFSLFILNFSFNIPLSNCDLLLISRLQINWTIKCCSFALFYM